MSYFPFTLSFLYRFLTFLFLSFRGSLESWTIKKAERWRTDAFELRCWRRLLRVPWTAWRSNQFILKEISPEYSLEGLMLKLKLQYTLATWYKELTHWKRPWHWERLKAAGEGEDRGWNDWMASPTWWTWVWATSGNWCWIWMPGVMQPMGSKETDLTEWQNWTELRCSLYIMDTILWSVYTASIFYCCTTCVIIFELYLLVKLDLSFYLFF